MRDSAMIDAESESIGWKVGAKIGIEKRWCKEGEEVQK
jgi:hypothetical protein